MYSNHTVGANVPEILNEESISDVDEGICHQFASYTTLLFVFLLHNVLRQPSPAVEELTIMPLLCYSSASVGSYQAKSDQTHSTARIHTLSF